MNKFQLTQEGLNNLEKELLELTSVKRPKAVERLSKARSMGDLSENSEYHAAKEDLGVVEGRSRELQELIKHAEVVDIAHDKSVVALGRTVSVEVNGQRDEYKIVGEFEANPMEKKLSSTSPIGKALIGHKTGESVDIKIPAGKIIYKILSIS
ncbi:transcription elongation factor GreA [Candidatus Microgenomates bacterium]|nr:transcription elongation factor GreA [Candidatus Microgenomates bacterium]